MDIIKTDYDMDEVMTREEFEIERNERAKKAKPLFFMMVGIVIICSLVFGLFVGIAIVKSGLI